MTGIPVRFLRKGMKYSLTKLPTGVPGAQSPYLIKEMKRINEFIRNRMMSIMIVHRNMISYPLPRGGGRALAEEGMGSSNYPHPLNKGYRLVNPKKDANSLAACVSRNTPQGILF